ncbi:MAG: efflux RND transporter periplasmic adaptor subunit [Pseudomonadota bacterium]
MKIQRLKPLLIIPAILVGVGIFVVQKKIGSKPVQLPVVERATSVRVMSVPRSDVIPHLSATGNVQPGKVWNAVAQVSGKVVELHPRLERGELIRVGEVLLKIDPSDYELAIVQAETAIESTGVQLAQVDVQEQNARASLEIEQQALKITEDELQRKQRLLANKTVSHSEYEKEQRVFLQQKQSVQALLNSITLYPVERKKLQAELAKLEAQLAAARLSLERTTVTMPFNGRIAKVAVEDQQLVNDRLGAMVVADGIDKAEVAVQIPMGRLAGLIHSREVINIAEAGNTEIGKKLGLTATVLLQQSGLSVAWDASVARLSDELDPRTRTIGVIVEVDKPYAQVQPGKRPPLVKGMFVKVDLSGRPYKDAIVIPASALHQEMVYLVDAQQRLERRQVKPAARGADYVVIKEGLEAGERIVLSGLAPAIDGMLLAPVDDEETLQQLLASVKGGDK